MNALKIRMLYRVLLIAALLVLGDCVSASELPARQPSIGAASPRVDPQHYWFSRRGSWLTIYPNDASTLRLYYSYLSDGWDEALNIRFLRDGTAVETSCSASPVLFEVEDKSPGQNGAQLILSGERDALIAASGFGDST